MRLRRWFLASSFLLVCASALGQSMKLLTQDTGWVVSGPKLFWTTDNGSHWKNITPHVSGYIDDVFFLDTSRGWAVLSSSQDNDMVSFRLARTTDSGQSWTSAPFQIPNQEAGELSGTGWLDFVDSEHGWFMLKRNSSSAFSLGRLFGTSDGGTSWHVLDAPIAGRPVFVTAQNGWISGDSGGPKGIYSTRDGGKTWQEDGPVLQKLPATLPSAPGYRDAQFTDAKHGFILISLGAANDAEEPMGEALVLYVTDDGGQTWNANRILTDRGAFTKTGAAMSRIGASAVIPDAHGTTLIVRFNDRKHSDRVTLMAVANQGETTTNDVPSVHSENVLWRQGDDIAELSFASTTQGWARTSVGDLLRTMDGGATWKDISPIPVTRPTIPPTPNPAKFKAIPLGPGPKVTRPLGPQGQSVVPESSAGVGLHYTERLGFDEYSAASVAAMGTWFSSSPFFDTGIYVGGINYCGQKVNKICTHIEPGLTALWLTQIQAEGWGILPIWVGPQAPCNGVSSLTKMSTTPATAQTQGATEADSAATAMDGYGLSGTVVFYDMENYSATAGSQCSLAVRAFLTGWVEEMMAQGFQTTAVYGNPVPAQRDFSQVPNLTQVWISATPASGSAPRVTIWGLGTGSNAFSDTYFNDAQRAHQFLIDVAGTAPNLYPIYGGVNTKQKIDYDVENLLIAGGSGTKNYIWTTSTINAASQFPNAAEVFTPGINDVLPGATAPAFINAGQLGQIVGYWHYEPAPLDPCSDSGCSYGFLYAAGSFTSFSDPSGPSWTEAYGMNNAGRVAGDYCYGTFPYHGVTYVGECDNQNMSDPGVYPQQNGFLGTPATGSYSIVTPDATQYYTYVTGINDDQQTVGYSWLASNNQVTSFLYQNSSFTQPSISEANCPPEYEGEGLRLEVLGINGYSQMVGICEAVGSGVTTAFLFDPTIPATIPISPPGAVDTVVWNINNQGQILGQYTDTTAAHAFILDNGMYYALPGSPNSWSQGNSGFNDAAQVVGYGFETCALCIEVANPE